MFNFFQKKDQHADLIAAARGIMANDALIENRRPMSPDSLKHNFKRRFNSIEEAEAEKLLLDAKLLEKLGCFALVLEKIPAHLAEKVAKSISIPVIGIGAGGGVDGQVLVIHDMLGLTQEFSPRFLRRYLNLAAEIKGAVGNYVADVKSRDFPNEKEQYD